MLNLVKDKMEDLSDSVCGHCFLLQQAQFPELGLLQELDVSSLPKKMIA